MTDAKKGYKALDAGVRKRLDAIVDRAMLKVKGMSPNITAKVRVKRRPRAKQPLDK
jgi:hypothetical protein